MNKSKVILFYELCRLCLEKPGVQDMFEDTDLIDDIFLCTGVHVTRSDNLPQKICVECLDVVKKAKCLRELATANDKHLRSLFDDDTQTGGQNLSDECTDSDATVLLEISMEVGTDIKEGNKPKKRPSSDKSEQSNTQAKKIAVRKDLFDSSSTVTSSTKDSTMTTKQKKKQTPKGPESSKPKGPGPESCKPKREGPQSCKPKRETSTQYICEVCDKKFDVWKKFYLHQRSHNKSIVCPLDTCGKKFATKGDLEKHIRSHTGDRPYHCEICDKSFTQRGTLKSHRETVHADVIQKYII